MKIMPGGPMGGKNRVPLLQDDNLQQMGAKKVMLNDHSKLLKDYKDRAALSSRKTSPFNYIALED